MAQASKWLPALAAARARPAPAGGVPGAIGGHTDAGGGRRVTLQLSAPAASSQAVAELLLQAFVDGTAPQARAGSSQQLPRGLEITVAGREAAAAADGGEQAAAQPAAAAEQQHAAAAQPPIVVHFTATDEAANMAQVEQAARLFEAYWSMHTKAAKSDLHCRMRQRLAALGQQLALQRLDGST